MENPKYEYPDIDAYLPSNEEIYESVFHSPNDRVGIYPEPPILGWLHADGIDEKHLMSQPPLQNFDPAALRKSHMEYYPPGTEIPDAPPGVETIIIDVHEKMKLDWRRSAADLQD